MALSIKNEEVDQLARKLARLNDESLTEAVLQALRERLERMQGRKTGAELFEAVERIQERIARAPELDSRTSDEIIGYDEHGLPR